MPADVPYLTADPRRVAQWRQRLAMFKGRKIGIHWQGNKAYALDRKRSIPLGQFAPLWQLEGVQLFSLQKGEGAQQLAELHPSAPIHDLSAELDPGPNAFVDTAAVMQLVDLVITSDTATAHLAGALGVPVWVALCFVPDWRWFLDRGDSPWYPTMRLFRQATAGDWQTPMSEMARLLRERIGAHRALLSNDDVDPST
jgi:ADP-heptose:LPS heptosyltransferase